MKAQGDKIVFFDESRSSNEIMKTLGSSDKIKIENGQWNEKNMKKLCPLIREWNINNLQIQTNRNPTILKQLSNIKLNDLKDIELYRNEILSIEGLSRIHMPALQKLNLCWNYLTNAREFRKVILLNLNWIALSDNKLVQSECFPQMKSSQELECLYLEYFYNKITGNKDTINNVSWICKMECKNIINFYIKNKQRIKQKKLLKAAKGKYSEIIITQI